MPQAGKKIFYGALGFLFTGLGILGVWIPGLPTTVFILLAMWAFSNSSKKLHNWLLRIPILKHAVSEARRFQNEGTVDIRAKFISQLCSWLSFVFVTVFLQNFVVSLVVGLLALSCSVFMYTVPTAKTQSGKIKD